MRGLNPSAVLNLRYPSMAFTKVSDTLGFDKPGELRFTPKVHRRVRNSSISRSVPVGGKINSCAPGSRLRPFGQRKTRALRSIPLGTGLWFALSSGERIRTTDLRVMSPTSYLCSTPHRLLNDQNFTPSCLIRQAKHLSTTQPHTGDKQGYIINFYGFSSKINLFLYFVTEFKLNVT